MQKKYIWIIIGAVILVSLSFFVFAIRNIFEPSPQDDGWNYDLSKMTNEEIKNCLLATNLPEDLNEDLIRMLGEDQKVSICPQTDRIYLKSKGSNIVAIGIKNLFNEPHNFSYEISVASDVVNDCGKSQEEILNLIISGKSGEGLFIDSRDISINKISFAEKGYPTCDVRYRIIVYSIEETYSAYATSYFVVRFN